MYLSPINYQPQVARNNNRYNTGYINFQAKPQMAVAKKVVEPAAQNSSGILKKTGVFFATAFTALAGYLGIKKNNTTSVETKEALLEKIEKIENANFDQKKKEAQNILNKAKSAAKAEYDAAISAAKKEIGEKRAALVPLKKAEREKYSAINKADKKRASIINKADKKRASIIDKEETKYDEICRKAEKKMDEMYKKAEKDFKSDYISSKEYETRKRNARSEYKAAKNNAYDEYWEVHQKAYDKYWEVYHKAYDEYWEVYHKARANYAVIEENHSQLDRVLNTNKEQAETVYKNKCAEAENAFDKSIENIRYERISILAICNKFIETVDSGLSVNVQDAHSNFKRIYSEVEQNVDEQLPPADTIRVIDYDNTVIRESHYSEGYYMSPPNAMGNDPDVWVSGEYTPGYYKGKLTYEYNGTTTEISGEGYDLSSQDLLNPICDNINKQRAELREKLIDIEIQKMQNGN